MRSNRRIVEDIRTDIPDHTVNRYRTADFPHPQQTEQTKINDSSTVYEERK